VDLSLNKQKYLTSLHQKKTREEEGVFIAEGIKVINDLVKFGFIPQLIAYDPGVWDLKDFGQAHAFCDYYTLTKVQAEKISLLSTPAGVLAVFPKPEYSINWKAVIKKPVFIFENINDPGNLGTIIRTAHWYGIHDIFITRGSVEVFSPKVVQASMGSLAAVKVHSLGSEQIIENLQSLGVHIYVTDMDGLNIHITKPQIPYCVVFGNESNGVSDSFKKIAKDTLTITASDHENRPESLNLSVSTAIFMDLLTRS